jgi:hypothetical protein
VAPERTLFQTLPLTPKYSNAVSDTYIRAASERYELRDSFLWLAAVNDELRLKVMMSMDRLHGTAWRCAGTGTGTPGLVQGGPRLPASTMMARALSRIWFSLRFI